MKKQCQFYGIVALLILSLAVLVACGSNGGGGGGGGDENGGGGNSNPAQGSGIRGYVYVPASSKEIARDAFASPKQAPAGYVALDGVVVTAQGRQTTTNSEGYFELNGLTASNNERISFAPPSGYEPFEVVTDLTDGAVAWINDLSSHSVSPLPVGASLHASIGRIDTSNFPTVTMKVQVYDSNTGAPVLGLNANNFTITNAGKVMSPITVTQASQSGRDMSVALVLDRSGSMLNQMNDLKLAAKTFVSYMNPTGTENDRAEIISFATDVRIDQPFTSNKAALSGAVEALVSSGVTSLFDATVRGIQDTTAETNLNKAVIAMTDGMDNNSSATQSSVINAAVNALIPVYTVGLGVSSSSGAVLQNIASATGAAYYATPDSTQLQELYTRITSRIQQEYLITYTDNTAGKRDVKIEVNFTGQTVTDNEIYGKSYALLVGIEDYQSVNDLNYTWDDVVDVKGALESTDMWSGAGASITTLKDSAASRTAVLNNISSIAGQMTKADLFLFHFSGHGGAENTGEQYLCAWNSSASNYNGDIMVSALESALDAIPKSSVSNVYVILDACHSGNFIGRDVYGNTPRFVMKDWQALSRAVMPLKTFKRDLNKSGYNVMAAAAGTESSWDVGALQNGLFTYYLVEGLGSSLSLGPANTDSDASISMEEAFDYLEPLVINYSTNNIGTVQSPQSYDMDATHPARLKYDW